MDKGGEGVKNLKIFAYFLHGSFLLLLLWEGAERDDVARGGGGGRRAHRHLDHLRLVQHHLVNLWRQKQSS